MLTVNGNGVRATARSLGVSKGTVISTLRSFEPSLWYVNHAYLENMAGKDLEIEIVSGIEAEQKWTRCGVSSATNRSSTGFGGR